MKIIESSREEMIMIDEWSANDFQSLFQEVIKFVNVTENELPLSKEISEEYEGKNLNRRIIVEKDIEHIFDFKYTYNANEDWITKLCLYKEEKITEEKRVIAYH